MSDEDTDPPVACTLSSAEKDERPDEVRAIMTGAFDSAEELRDGYTLYFEGTDEPLAAVAAFTSNELECCSFAEYTIEVSPPYEETRFTVTGPDGAKELLGEGLIEELEGEDS
jgi:hypothetical protein